MTKVAFLGLGAMGARIAANLIGDGVELTVWNRDLAKATPLAGRGARVAASPRAAAAGADIVISMVRDDAAAQAVWLDPQDGAFESMRAGAIGVESSTLSHGSIAALAREAAARKLDFIDAPVVGSRPQAEARQLIYLVGGNSAALSRVEPLLARTSALIRHAGPIGAGTTLKHAVNALLAVEVAALAEIFGLIERREVDLAAAADILGATPVASPAIKGAAASMLARAFAPLFPVDLMDKDLGAILTDAGATGATTPLIAAAQSVFQRCLALGFSDEHVTSVRKLYEAAA